MMLSMHIRTIHSLNLIRYDLSGKHNKQFYLSDTYVTLKLGQSHRNWYESVKAQHRLSSYKIWSNISLTQSTRKKERSRVSDTGQRTEHSKNIIDGAA